jgi:hypothetical protein
LRDCQELKSATRFSLSLPSKFLLLGQHRIVLPQGPNRR